MYEKAIEDLNKAIEIRGGMRASLCYNSLSEIYKKLKKYNDALFYCNKAIETANKDSYMNMHYYFDRGQINEALGQYENAIKDYTQAKRLDPNGIIGDASEAKIEIILSKKN